jgi:beta-phosphoglucomutase-like phosphatase (HAD superfamily)
MTGVEILLCDADGNLFPSEEPAFEASAEVTNACLAEIGAERRVDADGLRRTATGRTFRRTIVGLLRDAGLDDRLDPATLERWVAAERDAVTAHLGDTLRPDLQVSEPLRRLADRFGLAVVSSSALGRLDACFEATRLAELFPAERRYSAEDSLPVPVSKPDPAIYLHAGERLRVSGSRGLAIEDSVSGAESAVAAGFTTVGNVVFVPADERAERRTALLAAGARHVVSSWAELEELLA